MSSKGALTGLRKFCKTESPSKMMKKAFYFTLKALFVLNIFKFSSWLFGQSNSKLISLRIDKLPEYIKDLSINAEVLEESQKVERTCWEKKIQKSKKSKEYKRIVQSYSTSGLRRLKSTKMKKGTERKLGYSFVDDTNK